MAQQNKATFEGTFNDPTTGLYKTNTTGAIGSDDQRTAIENIADSVPFTLDDSYTWPFPKANTAGTNTYTATFTPTISTLVSGMKVHVKIKDASTGASTLQADATAAKKIFINPTTQAGSGDLVDEQEYIMSYDSALDAAAGGWLIIGGGGGAVDSVNGQTGTVVLDAGDIANTPAGGIAATDVQAALNELDTEKQSLINSATALTDAASIDLTAIKHTLTTASGRTFTISYTGDDITVEVTLNAASATQTFPVGSLCVSEGVASGDNTCGLSGTSGDKYIISIKKIGSAYYVVAKNFGQ